MIWTIVEADMTERDPVDSLDFRIDSPPKGEGVVKYRLMIPVKILIKLVKFLRRKLT